MDRSLWFLSVIIFLPSAGALAICFLPKHREDFVKLFAFNVTILVFLSTLLMLIPPNWYEAPVRFAPHTAEMQHVSSMRWIESFNIFYTLGVDGISFPLVLLTSFLSMLASSERWIARAASLAGLAGSSAS